MNGQSNGFTATQTNKGFHVVSHDKNEEFEISIHDFNEFANKYAQDTLQGKETGAIRKGRDNYLNLGNGSNTRQHYPLIPAGVSACS